MNVTICPEMLIDTCIRKGISAKTTNTFVKVLFPDSPLDTSSRKKQINKYKEILEDLKNIPLVEQRTPEWYEIRRNLITASDFAQALGEGKFGSQKQLYKNKCGYEETPFNASLPPLKWGTMFEYVAQTIYSQRNSVHIHEFGLVPHPSINYFGASPDGITEDGIMLEIKCPFKRKITGEIPTQYYYQIQGQLDVCNLDECDYLECELKESDEFISDNDSGMENGCIIEDLATGKYIYSDIKHWDKKSLDIWVSTTMKTNGFKESDIQKHYWILHKYNVIRVFRNKEFFNEKIAELKGVWDKIIEYRADEGLYKQEVSGGSSGGKGGDDNSSSFKQGRNNKHQLQLGEFLLC